MKYCSKCGQQIHDEAVICVHCGCAVETVTFQKSAGMTTNHQLMNFVSEAKSIFALGITSLVLCLGIGIIFQIINMVKTNKFRKKGQKDFVFPEFNLIDSYDIQMYEDAKKKIKNGNTMTAIGFAISGALIWLIFWFGVVMGGF